ncbi:MAG TPA: diaminopimelate epimerase [Candidatus Onthenecus intestinigallinarum]|uniref:Diaminopimelate epimerase n=1 Tax=Candidatus Onthenecus intestinigallinarum TaxID=2840875 RepID=A0A9D0ZAW2_9FIRM|nr:diaminopimelate epimerase [Candidatus Onthenecus intestinigallinarum]
MRFVKMHGLGNDYIYVDTTRERVEDPQGLAVAMSRPHVGVGADGLVLIGASQCADLSMRMFNADGSEGEMCGNAVRCIGKYAYERGLVRRETMTLQTRAGVKTLRLTVEDGRVSRVRVDMGAPILDGPSIPALLGEGRIVRRPLEAGGRAFEVTCVSMGNPHAVIFLHEDVDAFDVGRYGPLLERHAAFPNRTNVEFAALVAPGRIRMRVWERGSGMTLACGTGACATAVAASLCGLTGERSTLVLDGGELDVEWSGGTVYMTGPATFVFEGDWPAQGVE